jgi:ferredoxin-NADP reductase
MTEASPIRSGLAGSWQEAVIEDMAPLTARVRRVMLRPARWRPFIAGQHLDIRLTAPDGYQAQRSYSIASAPETEAVYELAIERLEEGEVSLYFHDIAQPGDAFEIRGPIGGHFAWRIADGGPVLLIGGGSGVVPLMSMLRHAAAQGGGVPMALLYGARSMAEAPFAAELLALDGRLPGLRVAFALSREAASRPGDVGGRIGEAALRAALSALPGAPRVAFVCGANRFVETVTGHLVALGQPPASIRTERFGGD